MTRVLFPFVGETLTRSTLEAALELARSRDATLVPVYLMEVPPHLSLEAAAPVRLTEAALPLLELIEQRATSAGVAVDARIERGRTASAALAGVTARERHDVVALPPELAGLLQGPGVLLLGDFYEAPDLVSTSTGRERRLAHGDC